MSVAGALKQRLFVYILPLGLWLMLWGGLLTYLEDIRSLGSPGNIEELLRGVRALLPFIAGAIALGLILRRPSKTSLSWLRSPLGLLTFYGFIGILSSLLFSPQSAISLYWASLYICVLLVIWSLMMETDVSSHIRRLILLNWGIVVFILIVILLVALISVKIVPGSRLSGTIPFFAPEEVYGGYGINANGVGRFAAIAALVALAQINLRSWRGWTPAIFALYLISLTALLLTQSRTGVYAFLIAVGLLLLLPASKSKKALALAGVASLLLLIFYSPFFSRLQPIFLKEGGVFSQPDQQGRVFSQPDQLTGGRLSIGWEGICLVRGSPFIGFGFQSDRLLLNKHMHNAYMQALVQTGALGTIAFIAALVWSWVLLFRMRQRLFSPDIGHHCLLIEVVLVFAFLSVRTLAESTAAFFGVDLLLLAPLLGFIQLQAVSVKELKGGAYVR